MAFPTSGWEREKLGLTPNPQYSGFNLFLTGELIMTQELTLTLDDNLIHRAKSFVAKQSISVRQMLSDLLARVIVQLDDGAHIDDERHNKLMRE
jgi:hypothetical protein